MVEISPRVQASKQLDEIHARRGQQVASQRQTREALAGQSADAALRAERANQLSVQQKADETRRLDAEQRQRAAQQATAQRLTEQDRQDAIDAAQQAASPLPRGSIVDVVA